jgi:hypothetical protein
MDHNFFLNRHSLPAQDRETAYEMLTEACQGMLNFRLEANDRILLYYEDPRDAFLDDCVLAEGFTTGIF